MTCKLIDGIFGVLVQVALGLIAISVLVLKWYFEKPRREPITWFLDVSKQVLGALVAHLMNIVLALVFEHAAGVDPVSGEAFDQCGWYFINYVVDVFLGLIIAYHLLKLLKLIATSCNWRYLTSMGEYEMKPGYQSDCYKIWGLQTLAWVVITVLTKVLCGILILIFLNPLGHLSAWLFSGLRASPQVELILVMIVAPAILNCFQFFVIDNILKQGGITIDKPRSYESFSSENGLM